MSYNTDKSKALKFLMMIKHTYTYYQKVCFETDTKASFEVIITQRLIWCLMTALNKWLVVVYTYKSEPFVYKLLVITRHQQMMSWLTVCRVDGAGAALQAAAFAQDFRLCAQEPE